MSDRNPFFTKKLSQTLTVIQRMASPKGTTVTELAKCLSLKRRSVFRLIRAIEHKYHIPVVMKRVGFGSPATYRLQQPFIDSLSNAKTVQKTLTFEEAVLLYLLAVPGNDVRLQPLISLCEQEKVL